MLKEITIGKYYPAQSVIHKLDPRVKLAGTILYVISLFPYSTAEVYLIASLYLAVMIKISRIPVRYMLKGLKPVIILIAFTAIFNLFLTPGMDIVFSVGSLHITRSGIKKAVFMVLRLIYLIMGSSLLTYTTTPNHLTDGIEKALRPLNKVKVPVHEFALMMSLALRFIPILMEEAEKITKAQSARGADFEEGGFIKKAGNIISIIVPLLVSATRRAGDLALAMDARCYHGGSNRTKLKPLKYSLRDFVGYFIVIFYFVIIIVAGHYCIVPFNFS